MKFWLYRLFYWTYALEIVFKQRFTATGLVVFLSLITAGILGLDTKQTMAYQIFTFLLAILLLSWGLSWFYRPQFKAIRILPKFGTVETPLQYRVLIENPTPRWQYNLTIFDQVADPRPSFQTWLQTPESNEAQRTKIDQFLGYYRWLWLISKQQKVILFPQTLPPLPPRSTTEVSLKMSPFERGIVRLHHLTVGIAEPLGLIRACRSRSAPQSLCILPKRYQVPALNLLGVRQYHPGGVTLASSVGDAEEFMSLRKYRPGDPLRKIHWKSWAKTGKPVVKEEQDEFFVRHALILDTFQAQIYSDKLEEAISVASSFACNLETQESLLDLIFVGTEIYCFTSGRGLSYTDSMLEILASVQACCDRNFDELIPLMIERSSLLSSCICILLQWDEQREEFVKTIQQLGIPILILLLTTAETREQVSPDIPPHLHLLSLNKIQESLFKLG